MTDHQPIQSATPAEKERLRTLVEQLKATPSVQEHLRRHWSTWKRGRIVAPGTLEDRMELAYYEGFDFGVQQALGAVWLMERLMEAQDTDEDST